MTADGRLRVEVVGGGISGLAAAWELSTEPGVEVTVLEASSRLGGKIATSEFAGRLVDEGADAFLQRVPDAIGLCREIGLTEFVSPANGSAMVLIDGELKRLPTGLVLGVPTDFDALAASGILTADGVARARQEPHHAGGPLVGDATIGDLITDHYGPEVTERLVGPLLGGIAAGSISEMSLQAIAPQLADAAQRSASLTSALGTAEPSATPIFAAPVGGMEVLIERLRDTLAERGVTIRTDSPATHIDPGTPTVITTDAPTSARLIAPLSGRSAELLGAIDHASVVFVTLACDPATIARPLDASGFLVPRDAGLAITAVSWASTKWDHLGNGQVILRVGLGHSDDPEPIGWSDEELLAAIERDLGATMGLSAAPSAHRITRYPDAFPQYAIGHLERTTQLEEWLASDTPATAVCGMAHRGVGIPACIREARRAARQLIERVRD